MRPSASSVCDLAPSWAAGDRDAGGHLIRRHDDWIVSNARYARFDGESLDDVAQVMRRGFLYQCELPMGGLTDGIICSALRKRMRQWLKKERECQRWASLVGDSLDESADDAVAMNETDADVFAPDDAIDVARLMQISRLSVNETRVVAGLLREDSFRDIAKDLGVGVGSVSYMHGTALKKMSLVVRAERAALWSGSRCSIEKVELEEVA